MRIPQAGSNSKLCGPSLALWLCLLGIWPALGAEYSSRNIKVQAPRIAGIIGEKMTASGGVTLTSADLTLQAETVTWYFDSQSGQIQRLEASKNVRFRFTQKGKDAAEVTVEGEGDSLVYRITEGKAVVSAAEKPAKKAHAYAVERIPPKPDSAPSVRTYDIRALSITFDLKQRTFDASGEVEIDANLPEGPS
jgi:hypothetical protein